MVVFVGLLVFVFVLVGLLLWLCLLVCWYTTWWLLFVRMMHFGGCYCCCLCGCCFACWIDLLVCVVNDRVLRVLGDCWYCLLLWILTYFPVYDFCCLLLLETGGLIVDSAWLFTCCLTFGVVFLELQRLATLVVGCVGCIDWCLLAGELIFSGFDYLVSTFDWLVYLLCLLLLVGDLIVSYL